MTTIILLAVLLVIIALPLVKVFQGKTDLKSTKKRMFMHIGGFFATIAIVFVFQIVTSTVSAQEEVAVIDLMTGTLAQGLGFIAAAMSTGLSALGAGIAVAAATPAAIGAISENEKNFGKSLIFVVMGEGVAIYGLLISILIINAL